MSDDILRVNLRIWQNEDPDLFKSLVGLDRNSRARRLRMLLRAAIFAEQGRWISSSQIAEVKSATSGTAEKTLSPSTTKQASTGGARTDGSHEQSDCGPPIVMPAGFYIPPVSMGSSNDIQ